jgi:hypothetical protein
MLYRVLSAACVVVALGLFVGGATVGAQNKSDKANTHEGKVVSVKGQQLTMEAKGQKHTHKVAPDAKITCDGKNCKLDDLKAGTMIRVTVDNLTNTATRIDARTKANASKENR